MTGTNGTAQHDVTYYTVSNDPFFLGTVALFNSLHVTGNTGTFVVLDAGLTAAQRELLAPHADIVSLEDLDVDPALS